MGPETEKGPETREWSTPQKVHGTRGWKRTWEQKLGYPTERTWHQRLGRDLVSEGGHPPSVDTHAHLRKQYVPHPSDVGGKYECKLEVSS